MMLVDSCVWIDFLSGRDDHGLARALLDNRVALCGTVLAQVLSGVRKVRQRRLLEERFLALPHFPETREVFFKAATLYSDLRRKGITIPLSDCTIAAVALTNDLSLLTLDRHFDHIHGLARA
jgi:predicted nucleic acid-binding protein